MKLNKLIIIGGVMVIIGFVVPLLMVAGYVPKILILELIIGVLQMLGLLLGLIGSVIYVKEKRDKRDKY